MAVLNLTPPRQNQPTIRGVAFVPLVTHTDDRGYRIEILRAVDSHLTKFGQIYIVGNFARGAIRAFHKHELLCDGVFISHDAAKFILVDDRHGMVRTDPTWPHNIDQ